ncbi:MAG: fibrinogen-like YCDxxxxGGGW domain-containing protein, partial [Deltaproteobacteria bacterium]|nr:fibrinogen-like YCDxxxxGGGW domain-containing protein [Deltaproteobacteria bacterium]
ACAPAGATGACTAGRCVLVGCDAGRADCDGDAANGCEVDTATSTASCGVCGRACAAGEGCVAGACQTMASCREIHAALPALPNGAYPIDPDGAGGGAAFGAYCDMTSDGGGWTLALKADGAQGTFVYDSPLWSSADTLNPASTNLDPVEAKFASFARVPFTALRLALVDGGTSRAVVIPFRAADSLLSVFATGVFEATSVSRAGWTGLMASGSLQPHCNREGFNNDVPGYTRVRLGIVANQENDCASPDSRLGLGGQGLTCAPSLGSSTVGNSASCGADNGDRDTRAFGYLFVR